MKNNFRRLSMTGFYLVILSVVACSAASTAATPQLINYQGYLKQNGLPVNNANVNMEFRLYDAPGGGVQLCTSGPQSISVNYGRFNYQIGAAGCNLSAFDWQAQPVYLEIIVDGNTMSPRERLTAAPYSLSSDAGTPLAGFTIDNDNIAAAASSSVYFDGGAGANASLTWDAPGNRFILTTDGSTPADMLVGIATATTYFGDGSNLTGISSVDPGKVAKTGDAMTGNLNISQGGATSSLVVLQTGAADGAGYFETTVPGIGNAITAVSHSNGGGNAISAEHDGSAGAVAFFAQTGAINSSPALEVTTSAGSSAADFSNTDPTSASSTVNITTNSTSGGGALRAHSTGTAKAVVFSINNAASTAPVLAIATNSSQTSSSLIEGNHTGTAGDLIVLKSSGQRKAVVDRTGNIFASGSLSFDGSLIVSGSEGAPGEALVSNGPGAVPTWQIVGGGDYVDATGDTMSGALGIAQGGATASLYVYQTGTTNPAAYVETTNGGSAQPTLVLRGAGTGPLYSGNQTGSGELLHLQTSGSSMFIVDNAGNAFASGSATGFELNALSEIYINPDGPDGDSQINFYEAATPNGAYLRWSDGNDRFEFSNDVFMTGAMGGTSITSDSDIYVNSDGPAGDSTLYFYSGVSNTGSYLRWDDVNTRFAFSNSLSITGDFDMNGGAIISSGAGPLLIGDTMDLYGNTIQDTISGIISLGSPLNLNGNALQDNTLGDIVLGDSLDMNGHTLVDSGAGGVKMGDSLDMNGNTIQDANTGVVTMGSPLNLNGNALQDDSLGYIIVGGDLDMNGHVITDGGLGDVRMGDHLDMSGKVIKDTTNGFVSLGNNLDMAGFLIVDGGLGGIMLGDMLDTNGNTIINTALGGVKLGDSLDLNGNLIEDSASGFITIGNNIDMMGFTLFDSGIGGVMMGDDLDLNGNLLTDISWGLIRLGAPLDMNNNTITDSGAGGVKMGDSLDMNGYTITDSGAGDVMMGDHLDMNGYAIHDGVGGVISIGDNLDMNGFAIQDIGTGFITFNNTLELNGNSLQDTMTGFITLNNDLDLSGNLLVDNSSTIIRLGSVLDLNGNQLRDGGSGFVTLGEPLDLNGNEIVDGLGSVWVNDTLLANEVRSGASVSLNAGGPDADSFVYFFDGGSVTGAFLKWDDLNTRFETSHEFKVNGNFTLNGVLSLNGGNLNTNGQQIIDSVDSEVDIANDVDLNGNLLKDTVSGSVTLDSYINLNGYGLMDAGGIKIYNSIDFNSYAMMDSTGGSIAMGDNLNGGGLYNIINPSDERLKKNIRTIPGALDKMLALRGVNFQWNEPEKFGGRDGDQMGMIAQEVQRVFPDWIAREENGYLHLSIKGFEALAVESIRELNTKYDELAEKTDALEKENADLKTAIEEIKARLAAIEAK